MRRSRRLHKRLEVNTEAESGGDEGMVWDDGDDNTRDEEGGDDDGRVWKGGDDDEGAMEEGGDDDMRAEEDSQAVKKVRNVLIST